MESATAQLDVRPTDQPLLPDEIARALSPLRHTRLSDLGRAGSMQWFIFASDSLPPFSLHLQCNWHLISREGTLVEEADLERPASGLVSVPERDRIGSARRDERNEQVRAAMGGDVRVTAILVAANASFSIMLENGWELKCEPDVDAFSEPLEQWRMFVKGVDAPHVVFTSVGFEPPEA